MVPSHLTQPPQSRWVAPLAALGSATSVVVRAQDELTQKGCGRRLLRLWSQTAGRVSRRVLSREKNSARRRRFLRGSGIDQVIPEAVDVSAVRGRVASNLEGVVAGSFVVGAYVGAGAIEEGRKILDAFRVFAARRGPADLVVWGAGADQRLESTAAEMDLGDRVHCLEDPHEPAELISALQVVWSMGICERSRVTVLSAMALGVPVVCSHETDLAEGIREIGGALMRDVLWPRQFAEATRELAENSELTSALQSAGPILMNQRHRFYDHAVQIRELYDQLASGSMGSASGTGTGFKSSSTLT